MNRSLFPIAILLSALLSPIPARSESNIRLGLRAGVAMSNFLLHPTQKGVSEGKHFGPEGAFSMILPIRKNFSLESELGISLLGSKESYSMPDPFGGPNDLFVENSLTTPYFQIPVCGRLALGSGKVKVLLKAGPSLGVLMGAKAKSKVAGTSAGEIDLREGMEDVNLALLFGTGLEIPTAGKGALVADLRLNYGLTDITKPDTVTGDDTDTAILAVSLSLGYLFN